EAVHKCGFGGLLKMHRINVHRILCMWITNQFDTKAEAFNIQGSYLSLSSRDAEHLLDLPSQGEEIFEPPKTKNMDLFDEFKTASKQGAHIKLSSLQ
ncbi:Os01g0548000, partial [Oryza sativa Japonica Group]